MTDEQRIAKLEELLKNAVTAYNDCNHVEEMDFDWVSEAERFLAPPPGLLECRAICDQYFNGGKAAPGYLDYSTGKGDDRPKMKALLAAFKAGLDAQNYIVKSKDGGMTWYNASWSKNV